MTTLLREAMHRRLSRFLTGERALDHRSLVVLRSMVHGEHRVDELLASQFEANVLGLVGCLAGPLRAAVLEDAEYIAERWPLDELFVQSVLGADAPPLPGPNDPTLVGVVTIPGTSVRLPLWPLEAADPLEVFRWMATAEDLPGSKGIGALLRELGAARLQACEKLVTGELEPEPMGRRGLAALTAIDTEAPTLAAPGVAVIFLARGRALIRVDPCSAARHATQMARRALGPDGEELRRRAALEAIKRHTEERALIPDHHVNELADELRLHLDELVGAVGFRNSPPSTPLDALEQIDGCLAWDARFIDFVRRYGQTGEQLAELLRQSSSERLSKVASGIEPGGHAWQLWTDPLEAPRFLRSFSMVLWKERVEPRLEREKNAVVFSPSVVSTGHEHWVKVPKLLAPMSWAWGAPGKRALDIDGDRYALEPSLVEGAVLPRTYSLLPEGHRKRPHQTSLPIDNEPSVAFALAVASSTPFVLSPVASKLMLVALADESIRRGMLAQIKLGDLSRIVHPDTKRLQTRELEAVGRALEEMRNLFLFLPDGTKAQVFDVSSPVKPEEAKAEQLIYCGLTRTFGASLQRAAQGGLLGPGLSGREYRGEFLLNLSGSLRLPNKQPSLLRLYVRTTAHWNAAYVGDGAFDPERLPRYSLDEWGALTNTLSPAVVEYLQARGSGDKLSASRKVAASKERAKIREDLEELEARKLVVVSKEGDGYRLLPPQAYQEAWEQMRSRGGRPRSLVDTPPAGRTTLLGAEGGPEDEGDGSCTDPP